MNEICAICGRPAECKHHLIFGSGKRKLADEDGIVIPMCHSCHNMAGDVTRRIHDNPSAEALSKMLGQALWERNFIYENYDERDTEEEAMNNARISFMERYGRSYL